MKLILSRKGFDSQYGGQPSPILPDGTLLSMPIPAKQEKYKYSELFYGGKPYYKIIKELNPNSSIKEDYTCHLDPDLRYSSINRVDNWKPIFGQSDAAQGHLVKNDISVDDIFLFYGWFRKVELTNGNYSYIKGSPDLHVIFGYLQIGKIFKQMNLLPEFAKYHPHAGMNFSTKKNNCIYIANSELSFNHKYKGSSPLAFGENLVLTKTGMTRSRWELPFIFKDSNISYHNKNSFKENYFQSAAKGQEFVFEATDDLIKWALGLIYGNHEDANLS